MKISCLFLIEDELHLSMYALSVILTLSMPDFLNFKWKIFVRQRHDWTGRKPQTFFELPVLPHLASRICLDLPALLQR